MKTGLIQLLQGVNAGAQPAQYQPLIAALVALTGTNVFDTLLPRGYTLPAIALHTSQGSQDYDFDGPIGMNDGEVQIDIYGNTSTEANTVTDAVRALLLDYKNTALPDGTFVQACFLTRDMDMPYQKGADKTATALHPLLAFRVVTNRVL